MLAACPQIVLHKFVAVTSIDSGPLIPTADEVRRGWDARDGIAYSPRIGGVDDLPHDGYDEWYAFDSAPNLGKLSRGNMFEESAQKGLIYAFVNFGGFSLSDPTFAPIVDRFWAQLELLRPASYIAHGDFLNFVTSDRDLFESALSAFNAL